MRRIITALLGLVFPVMLLVALPASPASADTTPRCVTKTEFYRVYRGTTQARVQQVFGMPGMQIARRSSGYWDSRWVDDGYWEGEWVYDGYWDEFDNWVDTSYYDPHAYWIDDGYYEDYWVSEVDMVRSYPKCRRWGSGRVAVWFDNYTNVNSGMRVWKKRPNKPWVLRNEMLAWWNFWNARGLPKKS